MKNKAYILSKRGDTLVPILGFVFILFIAVTIAMFFLIPRKVKKVTLSEKELVQKVVRLSPADIDSLTEELKKREDLLKEKTMLMEQQEARIEELNEELTEVKKEILHYQDMITETVTQVLQEEKKNINKLAKVFGLMSPEEAVAVVRKLDDTTVASVLSSMKERASAKILGEYANLGEVHAERVARISEMMKKITSGNPSGS